MPTAGMKEEAQRYRDWKSEGRAGGTDVARRRATQILSGNELDPQVVVEMSAWFARHEVDKQAEGFSPGEDGYPSKGRVAWAAWGGDAGKSFSDPKSARIKELRSMPVTKTKKRAAPDALKVGDFVRWNASGGTARGKITRIVRDGQIDVPSSEFVINGTPEDPAALIQIYRDGEETDIYAGHRFSTLTKIDPIRSVTECYKRSGETTFAEKDERVYEFAFSSEFPVARNFGMEVLSHDDGALDLDRLNNSAPLLFNHDPNKVIGVVERAYVDKKKKKGYSRVRFSKNSFAEEVRQDVKDGILRNVSTGYVINDMEERDNDFLATNWQPYEVSIVATPADTSVGIGRSLIDSDTMPIDENHPIMDGKRVNADTASVVESHTPAKEMPEEQNLEVVRSEATKKAQSEERTRIREITALCNRHSLTEMGEQMIANGTPLNEARANVLEKLGAKPIETVTPVELNHKENREYKISAGIQALVDNNWDRPGAGFAREVSQEIAKNSITGGSSRSLFIPYSALNRATYVTSGATTGGNIVATDLRADDFIEALRNNTVMVGLGVQVLSGLVGDVAIPRRSGVASTGFLSSETTAITQSESTFDQISMTPKTLATLSKFSRNMLIQSTPGIEELVRRDLSDGINVGLDLGILNGSGSSGQPTGIMQTSGIGSVAIGTNGGAITVDKLIDLETAIMEDNAGVNADSISYVTNAKVMGAIKKLKTSGGEYLVNNNLQALGRGATPVAVNGYPLAMTNQVPSNLTKGSSSGVCSAVVMGDFTQAILGLYGGGVEITVGENADDFAKNLTSVKAVVAFDVAVRHAQSFAAILDVTT